MVGEADGPDQLLALLYRTPCDLLVTDFAMPGNHQADGYGVPNMQPAITGGTWVGGDPRALAMFVMTGGFDSASRKESDNGNVMPAFAQLSDAELAAILTFIRAKFGKGASAVSEADVGEARKSLPK